jgi:hypothetical protein
LVGKVGWDSFCLWCLVFVPLDVDWMCALDLCVCVILIEETHYLYRLLCI